MNEDNKWRDKWKNRHPYKAGDENQQKALDQAMDEVETRIKSTKFKYSFSQKDANDRVVDVYLVDGVRLYATHPHDGNNPADKGILRGHQIIKHDFPWWLTFWLMNSGFVIATKEYGQANATMKDWMMKHNKVGWRSWNHPKPKKQ